MAHPDDYTSYDEPYGSPYAQYYDSLDDDVTIITHPGHPDHPDHHQTNADSSSSSPPPPQAAAPQPPQIIPNESQSTSTGSLIDVDTQSVRTVPSDFMEQDIQTETQAQRIEHERSVHDIAREQLDKKKNNNKSAGKKMQSKAKKADGWILDKIAALSDTEATGLVYTNLGLVVGLGAALGYKGFRLYERGVFSWKHAGVGAAIVGTVALVEGAFSRYVVFFLLVFFLLSAVAFSPVPPPPLPLPFPPPQRKTHF